MYKINSIRETQKTKKKKKKKKKQEESYVLSSYLVRY